MLYCDRINVSKVIDFNKSSASREFDVCRYWYYLDKEFNLQPYVCNGCHDVLMMSMSLSNFAILKINI